MTNGDTAPRLPGRFPDSPTPAQRQEYARLLRDQGVPYLHWQASLRRTEQTKELRPAEHQRDGR